MSFDRDELILVLKAQQWQKCKGELNAFVALSGSCRSNSPSADVWEDIHREIKLFIEKMEDEGFDD